MRVFDSHFHCIDPRFHLAAANDGFIPHPFPYRTYDQWMRQIGIDLAGGIIVAGSFQGVSTDFLQLIPEIKAQFHRQYGAVINLDPRSSDQQLIHLKDAGVVGIRLNFVRGNTATPTALDRLARRIYDLAGWTTEVYTDAESLHRLLPVLAKLPAVAVNHVGYQKAAIADLYRLADNGVKVKASGLGRLDFDPWPVLEKINQINPTALMFGSDFPGTRIKRIFNSTDLRHFQTLFAPSAQQRIFYDNAHQFYFH